MESASCAQCGSAVDNDTARPPEQRTPCSKCGSTARVVHRVLSVETGQYVFSGSSAVLANAVLATAPSSILMQTVIVAGDKSSEGRLVEAVAVPWFDIIDLLNRDPELAFKISAEKWEEIVAGAYKKCGFDEVTLTPRSGDHGRDVIAVKRGLGLVRVIDQVKAYSRGHLVTADDVRALVGVLHGDGASKGFLTTTSDFAPRLRTDPLLTPFMPSRLELINGDQLLARLRDLAASRSS